MYKGTALKSFGYSVFRVTREYYSLLGAPLTSFLCLAVRTSPDKGTDINIVSHDLTDFRKIRNEQLDSGGHPNMEVTFCHQECQTASCQNVLFCDVAIVLFSMFEPLYF
jgi:hypothetical protein